MIGKKQLLDEIRLGNEGSAKHIAIVPEPDFADLKGSSIDLHLGRWFALPHQSKETHYDFADISPGTFRSKEYYAPFEEKFVVHPGRFMLAITLEWLRLPSNRAGYVMGKSNIGRRGLVIETAPGVHPNFNGCITLEMANLGEVPLIVRPGMKICQLFVHETGAVDPSVGSQFAHQIKPTFGVNR